jgi:hypothetical protein
MHGICHCTNCKRRTGSAFGISAYFDRTAVVAKTGETSVYAFHHVPQNHNLRISDQRDRPFRKRDRRIRERDRSFR